VLRIRAGGTQYTSPATPNYMEAGQWYHVASVDDGSTIKLFINGEALYTGATPAVVRPANWYIGYVVGNEPVEYFDGGMDEVRIVNAARPDNWITASYRSQGLPGVYLCITDIAFAPRGTLFTIQ
jgi:hypothetical protein